MFAGYVCTYEQRLCFDFDVARLSKALNAVAKSKAQPELNVSFTVKQPELLQAQLLENAAESARTRAEILCRASGMRLGELPYLPKHNCIGHIQAAGSPEWGGGAEDRPTDP